MIEIDNLIKEMQEVKTAFSDRTIDEVLKLFHIQSNRDLTNQIKRLANNG